jgi:hypothetical protein
MRVFRAGSPRSSRISGPTVDIGAVEFQYPALSTASLPAGTLGSAYQQGITETGDGAPFRYAVTGGALPPGLNLSPGGTLTGDPTAAGSFSFTVTDSVGKAASKGYSLTTSPATPNVSVNPVNLTYGTALANSQLSGSATWTVGGNPVTVDGTFRYTSAAGTDSDTTRVNDLLNGGGANGSSLLDTSTVHEDGQADTLFGTTGSAFDWFLAGLTDVVKNKKTGEMQTTIS